MLAVFFVFVFFYRNGTAEKVAVIHSDSERLFSEIDDLNSRVAELQREIDRVDDSDWKEVVAEVRSRVLQLQADGDNLSKHAIRLVSKLEALHSELDDGRDYDQ